jgi:hypothetical protein
MNLTYVIQIDLRHLELIKTNHEHCGWALHDSKQAYSSPDMSPVIIDAHRRLQKETGGQDDRTTGGQRVTWGTEDRVQRVTWGTEGNGTVEPGDRGTGRHGDRGTE